MTHKQRRSLYETYNAAMDELDRELDDGVINVHAYAQLAHSLSVELNKAQKES